MNTRFIASNLEEAEEELEQLTARAKAGREIPVRGFPRCNGTHLPPLELGLEWPVRTDHEWRECSDENYHKWQSFPRDLPLIGADDYYDLPEYKTKS